MNSWEAFYGPNVGYALELYERYREDPSAVDAETRAFFDQMGQLGELPEAVATLARPTTRSTPAAGSNGHRVNGSVATQVQAPPAAAPPSAAPSGGTIGTQEVARVVAAARLARSIREYGHLDARIDPLGSSGPGDPMIEPRTHNITEDDLRRLPASIVFPAAGPEAGTCLDAINRLRAIYCGPIGYEFDHVQDYNERSWLHGVVEAGNFRTALQPDQQRSLLRRLVEVDGLERYLHTVFQGQKRFSLEGNDALVPMLDQIVRDAEEIGVDELLIGMAHRGRLNVLAHVLDRPYAAIFAEFQSPTKRELTAPGENDYIARHGGGDVKYHRGAQKSGGRLAITLADNPSHLEYVNPVVEGLARAAQDDRTRPGEPVQNVDRALAVTIHGDAAFPGEGVVAETLNLSALAGYRTGGTIHLIVNNQIGFTTVPEASRSTLYASDLAKGFEIPIVHVNADDPEACLAMVKLADAYRQRFHKDFLIDLVGYRRWGHNEGDEPAYTQPELYGRITRHPRPPQVYGERLIAEGVVTADEMAQWEREVQERLRAARDAGSPPVEPSVGGPPPEVAPRDVPTAVPEETLRSINEALLQHGESFSPNPKLERLMARRREAIDRPQGIDWGFAEVLAFGSILAGGTPIRLSGQDAQRGTFSQRHLVQHDPTTGAEYTALQRLPQAQASFAVYNSPLTEAAVIGFEYGYSVHAPEALVIWEAQYGDFANAGQVLIDQFISSARTKWQREPALVLLLPHGYEGGGPEHSSARLERFLQLAADGNMRVVNPSCAAQYFHLLRLQAALLSRSRTPLVVMTPKSLLRRPEASSSLENLTAGTFQPVLLDRGSGDAPAERLVLCSGKVGIDLELARARTPADHVLVARLEQLYPFPAEELRQILAENESIREVAWVQEEPGNMGAWTFVAPRLQELLPDTLPLRYIGRPDRASTATGLPDVHEWEQSQIVEQALAPVPAAGKKRRGK